jgi:imidazolonepropionase-like amidohydrolase
MRLAAAVAVLTALAGPAFAGITPPAHRSVGTDACVAVVDVTVVPMDRPGSLPHRTVVVRGDRIADVVTSDRPVPRSCTRIDGTHRYLIPGLYDTHVHLFGYDPSSSGNRAVERRILSMLLANGITTALVMEGTPDVLRVRDEVRRGGVIGPRLYSTGPLIQEDGSGAPPGRRTFSTPADVRAEVAEEKRLGYDFVKVHGDLSSETYSALLDAARENGIPVVGHAPPNLPIDATLDGGQVMITHAESYLDAYFRFRRPLPSDDAEIDRMVREVAQHTARRGVWVQPTLSVFRQIGMQVADFDAMRDRPAMRYMPDAALGGWTAGDDPYLARWRLTDVPRLQAQYRLMTRLVRGLHDAGVRLLAGTDDMVPLQLPGFSLRDELEQLVACGLTPFEALQTATANASAFLRDDGGIVAPGRRADLVLLAADPRADVDNVFQQDGLMLRGRWYAEDTLRDALRAPP